MTESATSDMVQLERQRAQILPRPLQPRVVHRGHLWCPLGHQQTRDHVGQHDAHEFRIPGGAGEEGVRAVVRPGSGQPGNGEHAAGDLPPPRLRDQPDDNAVNLRKAGRVEQPFSLSSSEAGAVGSGSIGGSLSMRRHHLPALPSPLASSCPVFNPIRGLRK